jgi:hypothetical protein
LFLEAENPEKPINIYINSPGGSVTAGMAIYDTVSFILMGEYHIISIINVSFQFRCRFVLMVPEMSVSLRLTT